MIDQYSKNVDMKDIGLFWQLTIKTIDDLKIVSNENLSLEMFIMQLLHLKNIDEDKEMDNTLNVKPKIQTSPLKSSKFQDDKQKIEITSFQYLIELANKYKEIELKYDLERNVKLVSFNKGKIDISFNEKLNKDFIKNLTEKLLEWTGERWIISLSKNSEAKSVYEKNIEAKNNFIDEFKKSKIAKEIETAFPDAKLIDIEED